MSKVRLSPEAAQLVSVIASELVARIADRYFPRLSPLGYVGDDVIDAPAEEAVQSVNDPWRVLGLKPTATAADVKRRARSLARVFHPDAGGDHEKMAEVNEAARLILAILKEGRGCPPG